MNKHVLTGRLTADPEVSYFGKDGEQKMMAKFTLMEKQVQKLLNRLTLICTIADFFRCVAFGKKADFVEKYVKKGMHLLITGPERNNNYKDKEGKTVYGMNLVIETIEMLDKKKTEQEADQSKEEFMEMTEEEMANLPFK